MNQIIVNEIIRQFGVHERLSVDDSFGIIRQYTWSEN